MTEETKPSPRFGSKSELEGVESQGGSITLKEPSEAVRIDSRGGRDDVTKDVNPVPWYKMHAVAITYVSIAVISLFMRLFRIGYSSGGTPVFDEKHYVIQGWQTIMNSGMENNPTYGLVVHPPLGKWLISLGEMIFGYTPLGWRFMSAIAGVIVVLATTFIVHRLTKQLSLAILTAIIINIEGTVLVMSRTSMLDIFVLMFTMLAVVCAVMEITSDIKDMPWIYQPWLLGAGVMSGLAMSVKISGVYTPAIMGVVMVFAALLSKNNKGKRFSPKEAVKALGSGLIYFLVVPLTIFISVWFIPWVSEESSVYRHASQAGNAEHPFSGFWSEHLPQSVQNFLSYQIGIMKFHSELKTNSETPKDELHPWESKPLDWLYGSKPMLFYDEKTGDMSEQVRLLGNPVIWMLTVALVILGIFFLFKSRDRIVWAIALGGFAIGYLPWLAMYERQMYFFYATAYAPFLSIMFAMMLYEFSKPLMKKFGLSTAKALSLVSAIPVTVSIAFFAYFSPWYYHIPLTKEHIESMIWFDSWESNN